MLSSQKRAEGDERNRKASGKPGREADERKRKRREAPVSAAVGAKPGRMKGNEQEAEYEEPGENGWETSRGGTGKARKRKRRGSTG